MSSQHISRSTRILYAQSGSPIAGAKISLAPNLCDCQFGNGTTVTPLYHQTSQADGRYEIRGVVPGEFFVSARAPERHSTTYLGYTSVDDPRSMYAAGNLVQIPIRVRGGEVIPDVDLRMDRRSTITGRIVDRSGNPIAEMDVEFLRKSSQVNGVPAVAAFTQTERVGTFRIDVPPGEYYVHAYPSESLGLPQDDSAVYAPTFFPGVASIADARTIEVRAGETIGDVKFMVASVLANTVSGRLTDPGGPAFSEAIVELTSRGIGSEGYRPSATVAPDGRFEIRRVVPGQYILTVSDGIDRGRWVGVRSPLTITGPVRGLAVAADRGVRITGRIITENATELPASLARSEVAFDYINDTALRGQTGRIEQDGTFSTDIPAGDVVLGTSKLPIPWIVKAVRRNGTDITDAPMRLRSGGRERIDIILSDRSASVSGTVTDARRRATKYAPVIIFPNDRSKWVVSRLRALAYSQHDGGFSIEGLPPNNYRVVALTTLPENTLNDANVFERLWSRATPFSIEPGQHLKLPLISPISSDSLR